MNNIDFIRLQGLAQNKREFIDIFEQVQRFLKQFVVFKSEDEPVVLTNYIVHTYLFKLFEFTPYIHIYSATKQCGKSLLMGILKELSCKGEMVISISEAIFRYIHKEQPTLVLDEVDRWDKESKQQVYGILNSGYQSKGGEVLRMTGKSHAPTKFITYCPKILGGIDRNSLPDTLQDRSISIELTRKTSDEPVMRYRFRKEISNYEAISLMLEPLQEYELGSDPDNEKHLFDEAHQNALLDCYEDSFESDRAVDIAEPLIVVASLGTSDWLEKSVIACRNLTVREDEEDSNLDLELLRVCNEIRRLNFNSSKAIFSADLVDTIQIQKDSELAYLNNGVGIDQPFLARRLKVFGIKPKTVRIGSETKRGYEWNQFVEPAKRFLSSFTEEEITEDLSAIDTSEVEQAEMF